MKTRSINVTFVKLIRIGMVTIETFIKAHLPEFVTTDFSLPFKVSKADLAKDQIITDYGQVENKIYFLNKGLVQVSIVAIEEEKILEFFLPGEFFCAYTSLLLQNPSDVQIITLTDCDVSVIDRQDYLHSCKKSLLASNLALHVTQQLYLHRTRREKDLLAKPADIRYKELVERNAELIKLLPLNKIAKYLGIQPESLSRIRKSVT